ncbi:MAG: outer membrane beta-barrel protein [Bosea sp. (in: a-proteobacteria)]
MVSRTQTQLGHILRGTVAGVSLLALLVALAPAAISQTVPDIRGTQRADPRDLNVDPRFLTAENPFQPVPLQPGLTSAPALPGADPSAPQAASGGAVTRRAASRASRPVQARVNGTAQRRIRAQSRQVTGLPTQTPTALGLRPTTSSRIVTQPNDGLQDYPSRRAPRPQTDPWEPLGLRLGSFIVSPSITQSLGYDTNPNRSSTAPKGSLLSRTDGELGVRSDWSTHSFTSTLRGGYSYFSNQRDASRPDATGVANLRLNMSRDTDIDIDGRLSLDTQRPGSTNFNAATRERPNVYGYGMSVGGTQRFNRLSLNLRGSVDRTTYDNATDTLGALIRQSDRNLVQYGVRARAGYELTPGMTPFVEVSTDTRVFDEKADASGFRRGSVGAGARVGTSFELTRLLTGEFSVGYQQRSFDDPRLKELRGLVGDANLIWSATPLTSVTLRGSTELADTTIPGVSGSVNRRVGLEVAHALRRNWTITGFANASRSSFDGNGLTEDTYQLGLRTEYRLTRTTAVRASFTHERLKSTTPGSDYTANIFLLGLRMQL